MPGAAGMAARRARHGRGSRCSRLSSCASWWRGITLGAGGAPASGLVSCRRVQLCSAAPGGASAWWWLPGQGRRELQPPNACVVQVAAGPPNHHKRGAPCMPASQQLGTAGSKTATHPHNKTPRHSMCISIPAAAHPSTNWHPKGGVRLGCPPPPSGLNTGHRRISISPPNGHDTGCSPPSPPPPSLVM